MTKVVVIDPGHGAHDPGASGHNIVEKNYVLKMAKLTKAILEKEYRDVKVYLTRDNDTYLTLSERARFARNKKADLFVSEHINAATAAAKGIETFRHTYSSASKSLSHKMTSNLLTAAKTAGGTSNRGNKQANFGVLRGTYKSMLSVLTETLFLTNKSDADILKTQGMMEKFAYAHAAAVADELGLKSSGKRYTNAANTSGSGDYKGETFATAHEDWWMKEREETLYAQQKLNELNYNAGPEDSILGQQTLNAVRRFQEENDISYKGAYWYGVPGPETREALAEATKAKMVIVTYHDPLSVRDVTSWEKEDVVGTVSKGETFTITDEFTVDGTKMYRLKSGLYITGHEAYVKVK